MPLEGSYAYINGVCAKYNRFISGISSCIMEYVPLDIQVRVRVRVRSRHSPTFSRHALKQRVTGVLPATRTNMQAQKALGLISARAWQSIIACEAVKTGRRTSRNTTAQVFWIEMVGNLALMSFAFSATLIAVLRAICL
jgi:hypothetical protein